MWTEGASRLGQLLEDFLVPSEWINALDGRGHDGQERRAAEPAGIGQMQLTGDRTMFDNAQTWRASMQDVEADIEEEFGER